MHPVDGVLQLRQHPTQVALMLVVERHPRVQEQDRRMVEFFVEVHRIRRLRDQAPTRLAPVKTENICQTMIGYTNPSGGRNAPRISSASRPRPTPISHPFIATLRRRTQATR